MKHLNVRLPDDLHAALVTAAKADRRSLNAEVVVMIEEALRGERWLAPTARVMALSKDMLARLADE